MARKKNFSTNLINLGSEHRVFMGLGDAVLRLVHVEMMYANNTDPEDIVVAERNLIVEALNQQYQLDLGLDCNRDGVPDSIEVFSEAASTNCCRILPKEDSSPRKKEAFPEPEVEENTPKPKTKSKARGGSRKKKTSSTRKKTAEDKSIGFFNSLFGGKKE